MARPCSHVDQVEILEPSGDVAGCEECLKVGGRWVHLRMCQSCGRIGCCDSSPAKHARAHALEAGHPILRSVEPGERWSWCVVDEIGFTLKRRDA